MSAYDEMLEAVTRILEGLPELPPVENRKVAEHSAKEVLSLIYERLREPSDEMCGRGHMNFMQQSGEQFDVRHIFRAMLSASGLTEGEKETAQ